MIKPNSPEELEFTINNKVVLKARDDGLFYNESGKVLDRSETYVIFKRWVRKFGEGQLGWATNVTTKCDCGGQKSKSTHSSWCSINQQDD